MAMKKFINDPANLTAELLEGLVQAYPSKVALDGEKLVVRAKPKEDSKVAIVTLGGAGHEPALQGFVGEGMLDISVVGDIFAAPGPPPVLEALRQMNRDAGVLFVVLNHAGDVMSANMALEMAEAEGLNVRKVLTHEDIAPGMHAPAEDKRGLVGCIPLYKVAGAAAEAGMSLDEVCRVAEKYNDNMATLAVALKTATHPQTGEEIFTLEDDEMEIGMGQHGEAGTGRSKMLSADETAERMLEQLLLAVKAARGDKLYVMINGAGATTLMELLIIFRRVRQILADRGIEVACSHVGEYLTVQEMAGFQMHVAKVDEELIELMNAPCDTPFLTVR
ncbi:MAG TPA: dihydroxyacetone kinase subunit DhaK [Phycisphaerae bacterium]|nr:dihydroxyacetone kinase subunit DhaK [Phycisphaerae bacterium]